MCNEIHRPEIYVYSIRETIAKSLKPTVSVQHENRAELQKIQVGVKANSKVGYPTNSALSC